MLGNPLSQCLPITLSSNEWIVFYVQPIHLWVCMFLVTLFQALLSCLIRLLISIFFPSNVWIILIYLMIDMVTIVYWYCSYCGLVASELILIIHFVSYFGATNLSRSIIHLNGNDVYVIFRLLFKDKQFLCTNPNLFPRTFQLSKGHIID